MPDHIHLFISTTPTVALTDVVRTLKAYRQESCLKDFETKSFYNRSVLYGVKDICKFHRERKRRNSSKVHTRTKDKRLMRGRGFY